MAQIPIANVSGAANVPVSVPAAPLFEPIKVVQIEGSTLLKLIKYCGESKTQVSGRLLGLQRGNVLEVTNCFSHFGGEFNHENNETILRLMKEIRQDHFVVGWYLSSINGNFLNIDTIRKQYMLQSNYSNSVCIVYDPSYSEKGRLALKAFKLTEKFMNFYKEEKFGATPIGEYGISSTNIFKECEIKLHCAHLTHAFLFEIKDKKTLQCDFERLHHLHSKSLTNNLKQLSNNIESYANETNNFRKYFAECTRLVRQRDEFVNQVNRENLKLKSRGLRTKPMPDLEKRFPIKEEIPRIESVVLNAQMNQFTKEVESSTMQGLAKLWISQGIQQDKPVNSQ